MRNLILREWAGKTIRQREDGFISLTDMCGASGKLFGNWHKTKEAQEYLKALQDKYYSDQNNTPIESSAGNLGEFGGTWGDRRVALRLAQWISADFALQVDEWVEELLTCGAVSIKPQEFDRRTLRPAIERVESLKASLEFFGIDQTNPRFQQGLKDLVGDVLGLGQLAIESSRDKWCGVAERAEQLGDPAGIITRFRSQLGKKVKAQILSSDRKEEDRLCNGTMRSVQLYRVSEALDSAIHEYLGGKD